MNKLMFVRHAESVGNKNNMLQGQHDYPLTDNGLNSIDKLASSNISKLKEYDSIISSPLTRTKQTANVIKEKTGIEINFDELLKEISFGVLDGMFKINELPNYKEVFYKFSKTGELNTIPGSENADILQIRCLMFLEQFINKNYNSIVVTHAGMLRFLLNTINGLPRMNNQDVSHDKIHEESDIFRNIKFVKNHDGYKVDTFDSSFIIKKRKGILEKSDYEEERLSKYLINFVNIPRLLKMSNRDGYVLKGYEYKKGSNDNLDDLKIKNTTEMILKMLLSLYDVRDNYDFSKVDMKVNLQDIISGLNDIELQKIGNDLLNSSYFRNGINNDTVSLIHNKLNKDNIIYDESKPCILGLDNIKKYPVTYQLASYIALSFLLDNPDFNIENILKYWNMPIDKRYLLDLIKYRLLEGIKEEKDNYKYVKCLKKIGSM